MDKLFSAMSLILSSEEMSIFLALSIRLRMTYSLGDTPKNAENSSQKYLVLILQTDARNEIFISGSL